MNKVSKDFEELNKSSDKLRDNLDKVDVKVNKLSVSAKDVASTYKREFEDVILYYSPNAENSSYHGKNEPNRGKVG